LILYKQSSYLQKLPLGYNPENVMSFRTNNTIINSYNSYLAVKQELLKYPEIKNVAGSDHTFGYGTSGQVIALWGAPQEQNKGINEYRMLQGMPELMELKLTEGRFWRESDPDSIPLLILNEAAVKMLGGESPLEKTYNYNGEAKVIGVVKDFYYDNPAYNIAPIVLSNICYNLGVLNIRFNEKVDPIQARQITSDVLRKFDPDFVLNPIWSVDIYQGKFKEIKTLTRTNFIGSAISILVAMLGLLAIHLYSAVRRTKEIGIRRIHGAEKTSVFLLLTLDILKWIGIAALFAIPASIYIIFEMLNNYANHIRPDWMIFLLPILIQCVIAILTTSGVSLSVLSQNPVKSLKIE
jgi:putative ABC transport system permease protein